MSVEVAAHVWLSDDKDDTTYPTWATQFCHLKIVDSKSLRFEVVATLAPPFLSKSVLNGPDILDHIDKCKPLAPIDLRVMNSHVNKHLLVRAAHIHELFPETQKMPFKVACDYVRDRL